MNGRTRVLCECLQRAQLSNRTACLRVGSLPRRTSPCFTSLIPSHHSKKSPPALSTSATDSYASLRPKKPRVRTVFGPRLFSRYVSANPLDLAVNADELESSSDFTKRGRLFKHVHLETRSSHRASSCQSPHPTADNGDRQRRQRGCSHRVRSVGSLVLSQSNVCTGRFVCKKIAFECAPVKYSPPMRLWRQSGGRWCPALCQCHLCIPLTRPPVRQHDGEFLNPRTRYDGRHLDHD